MMKTAVIGAGAMGSLFGGKLAAAGYPVVLYDINQEHVDHIAAHGLIIEEPLEKSELTVEVEATSVPEDLADCQLFIIFVKSTATEAVARRFSSVAPRESIVMTLQNGIGNEDIIRERFGIERTAAGVTSHGATFIGAGKVRHAGKGPTYLCMSDKNNTRLEPIVEIFTKAGFEMHVEKNIEELIWSKLIINVGINGLTALTGLTNGRLLDFAETRELMRELVAEAEAVVKAKGISLTFDNPVERVYEVAEKTALNRSSMLQDFDKKVASEIDFINSAIVREAEKLSIPSPVNRTVTRLVKTFDALHKEQRENEGTDR